MPAKHTGGDTASTNRPPAWNPPVALRELINDGETRLVAELIRIFANDTADRLVHLRAALASADFSTLRAEAHSIKGSARQMGAEAVATICVELEGMAFSAQLSGLAEHVAALETQVANACYAMAVRPKRR